ncbi:MAG: formate--tetrahydrofolate ligase [Acetilactobacillus jinshanensis]
MKSDIEISQNCHMWPIEKIAKKLNLKPDQIEPYGHYKAKVSLPIKDQHTKHKLILMTAINPTPAGEGKTTVAIGLADALNQLHHNAALALREPSIGPVMGMKGGAAGGGYAQVEPMEDINLHFTGDMDALTEAHDTLSALIDAHIHHGNQLNLDPRQITWHRVLDVNDRELRNCVVGLGGRFSGVPRQDSFSITAASELMAILCLSRNLMDMKKRISRIVIGYTYDEKPVTVKDLGATGALTLLLKDAIKPNLVQTLEHTPTFIHGGPFANIAHGCNSILATQAAMNTADYTVTEAGFGADLGAEKFMDIVAPQIHKTPDAVVIVASVRALKYNGGMKLADLPKENVHALLKGAANLKQHVSSMKRYGKPVVVAINRFAGAPDAGTDHEVQVLKNYITKDLHTHAAVVDVWGQGGKGALDLAKIVAKDCDQSRALQPLYKDNDDLVTKLNKIVKNCYGGKGIILSSKAKAQLEALKQNGWDKLPVCVAKTQYSLTDDAHRLGAPKGFWIHVRALEPKLGAGFIIALTGKVLTMPGLPSHPAALNMDIDKNGKITGLF